MTQFDNKNCLKKLVENLRCCVGGRVTYENLALSNEFVIKVELPPSKIWKVHVSSVSLRQFVLT